MNRKAFILSISLILAVLLFGGWFLLREQKADQESSKLTRVMENSTQPVEKPQEVQISDTVVDTSGWKTYRNEKYEFEVKYPSDWELISSVGMHSDPSVVSLVGPETREASLNRKISSSCDLSIYYYESVADAPENSSKETSIYNLIQKNRLITNPQKTTLGGIASTSVIWGGNGAYYSILSESKGHLYIVSFCQKENENQLTDVEREILSTFKYL